MRFFYFKNALLGFIFLIVQLNCKNAAQGEWIKGTEEEKISMVERQFRGFDMAMIEIGYRYSELYWAGHDENWEYAKYQLEKINLSFKNGIERRPKRLKFSEMFLNYIPTIQKSINDKNKKDFFEVFQITTQLCNSCHVTEKVDFFLVKEPLLRVSPIRK